MARTRSRTKMHRNEKITLNFEFDLTSLNIYPNYSRGICITTDYESECDGAVKLLKFMYSYINKDFSSLEKKLKLKLTSDGFFDKDGSRVTNIKL